MTPQAFATRDPFTNPRTLTDSDPATVRRDQLGEALAAALPDVRVYGGTLRRRLALRLDVPGVGRLYLYISERPWAWWATPRRIAARLDLDWMGAVRRIVDTVRRAQARARLAQREADREATRPRRGLCGMFRRPAGESHQAPPPLRSVPPPRVSMRTAAAHRLPREAWGAAA